MAVEFADRTARLLRKLAASRRAGRPVLSAGVVYLLSYLLDADSPAWGWCIALPDQRRAGRARPLHPLQDHGDAGLQPIQKEDKIAAVPVVDLFKTHGKNTLLGLGARYIEGVTFNTFGVFIVGYLTGALHLPRQTALAGVMISSAIMIVMLPSMAICPTCIGRRRLYGIGALRSGC